MMWVGNPEETNDEQICFSVIIKIIIKDMSENVKVMVRCRPFNSKESSKNPIININNDARQISISKPKSLYEPARIFTFDHIFGMEATQV